MNSTLRNVLLVAGLAAATAIGARAADEPAAASGATGAPAATEHPAMQPHGGMGHRLQRLTTVLELTPAQQEQVSAIFAASAQQRQAIMNEALSEQDRRTKLHTLMTDTQAKFRAALTLEQQKKLDAMPHRGRGRWGRQDGHGPGGPPPAEPAPAAATPPAGAT